MSIKHKTDGIVLSSRSRYLGKDKWFNDIDAEFNLLAGIGTQVFGIPIGNPEICACKEMPRGTKVEITIEIKQP